MAAAAGTIVGLVSDLILTWFAASWRRRAHWAVQHAQFAFLLGLTGTWFGAPWVANSLLKDTLAGPAMGAYILALAVVLCPYLLRLVIKIQPLLSTLSGGR